MAEQSRIVRLPLNKIGSINKINKTFAFLEQEHERPPSAEEIAKELDMTINDVKESMKNSGRHVSMDAPLIEGEDSNLYDVLNSGESPNPDNSLLHESLKVRNRTRFGNLNPKRSRCYSTLLWIRRCTSNDLGRNWRNLRSYPRTSKTN